MNIDVENDELSDDEFVLLQEMYSKAKDKKYLVIEMFKYFDYLGQPVLGLKVLPPHAESSSAAFIIRSTDED